MTDSSLSSLVGHGVCAVEKVHDYLQLQFDNGDVLNVYNAYSLSGADASDVRSVVGKRVTGVHEDAIIVQLKLGTTQISVSLSDDAFNGPEAMEYIPVSGSRVIWP